MKNWRSIFYNKYLITGIAFAIWKMFFDRNDLPSQIRRSSELYKMKQNQKYMALLIANTEKELQLLKTNPEIFQHAPLKCIASYLGVTDTSLSRIRKEFSKK